MSVVGTFHLPTGSSQAEMNAIVAQIAKNGVYDPATKNIIIKNDAGEQLFTVALNEIPKMFTGVGTGCTVAVSETGEISVIVPDTLGGQEASYYAVKAEVVHQTSLGVANGVATLDENGKLVEVAAEADGYTADGAIATKFEELDTELDNANTKITANENSITEINTKLAGITGAYVYIGKIDSDAPTNDALVEYANSVLSAKDPAQTLVLGHVVVDNAGNEWWFDGTEFTNLGQTIIANASNDAYGVVKGDGVYVNITDGIITVLKAQDAEKLGGQLPSYYATAEALLEAQTTIGTIQNTIDGFGDVVTKNVGTAAGNVVVVGENGKIDSSLIEATVVTVNALEKTLEDDDQTKLDTITTKAIGDIAIINTVESGVTYSTVSYIYNGTEWKALCGTLTAEDIVFDKDIVLAGDYTAVGNITKGATETKTLSAKGRTLGAIMEEIFTKTLQPSITANPAVSGFNITTSGAGEVEAGTKVSSVAFGTATLSAGSYTYGPATGITATGYSVKRVVTGTGTDVATLNNAEVATAASGSDDNSGNGFVIGDQGGSNTVATLKYTVTVSHGEGAVAVDNRGNTSNPEVKIASGSKTQTTSKAYSCYRKVFWGTTTDFNPTIDSDYIRALVNGTTNGKKCTGNNMTLTLNVPEGAKTLIVAYPATYRDMSSVKYVENSNSEVGDTFTKSTVDVEGANDYTAISYKVYVYSAEGGVTARTYNVTI